MNRQQIYFVAITYLKRSGENLSSLLNVNTNELSIWFEDAYGRCLDLSKETIEYINEIKINNNEVTFDSSPYNLKQARVHIKGAKFDDKYWLGVKEINTNKYIDVAPLRFTNSRFPQCDIMQRLTAADLGEIVSGNTSYDPKKLS